MPRTFPGLDGVPVTAGDTVLAADPDDPNDELAVCGTLVHQHGRWFVAAGRGELVPVHPTQTQLV